jgi:hypothetical protein
MFLDPFLLLGPFGMKNQFHGSVRDAIKQLVLPTGKPIEACHILAGRSGVPHESRTTKMPECGENG